MEEQVIAGYRVIRRLGAGGMGEVFLVQHPRLPRRDALKLLDVAVSRNGDFKVRFQREADLMATLNHPNIVTLHDRGEFEGHLWLSMEYVDGADAARLLRDQGPMPLARAIDVIAGAGAALDFAWQHHQITHRDVKPANILISELPDGTLRSVKLADFGIAKAAGESTSLTSTGVTIGTMAYISPESLNGESVDNRSDLYSLGCSAFQLLTGATPFEASNISALMAAHMTRTPPAISSKNPQLPPRLDAVFARVLAKRPEDRYQSCAEFVEVLANETPSVPARAALSETNIPTVIRHTDRRTGRGGRPPFRPVRRWVIGAAVALVVVCGVIAAIGGLVSTGDDIPASDPTPTPALSAKGPITTPIGDIVPSIAQIESILGTRYLSNGTETDDNPASKPVYGPNDPKFISVSPTSCEPLNSPTSVWIASGVKKVATSQDSYTIYLWAAEFPSEQDARTAYQKVTKALSDCQPEYRVSGKYISNRTATVTEHAPGRVDRVTWVSGTNVGPGQSVDAYSIVRNTILAVGINDDIPGGSVTKADNLMDFMRTRAENG